MLDRTIEVDDNLIDSKSSPFIIAEVGSNFNQNLDTCLLYTSPSPRDED